MKDEKLTEINSYLTFKLGDEEYALHVNKVLNILELSTITQVPKAPEYMKGVINLRGMVLPVIDARLRFGMSETNYTDKTCIVVLELKLGNEKVYVGALVDQVVAVLEIGNNEIKPPPGIGHRYRSQFISGMVNADDKFIMVLDMEKLFTDEEMLELKDQSEQKETVK
ncbi:MAG: chemotaxis protein CheW [Bacteroidales bacterium]|jgi:purine-binding chemotaxis protein CheW|nr:chemotaxis protein CheW [Bacteroidales bacterium]